MAANLFPCRPWTKNEIDFYEEEEDSVLVDVYCGECLTLLQQLLLLRPLSSLDSATEQIHWVFMFVFKFINRKRANNAISYVHARISTPNTITRPAMPLLYYTGLLFVCVLHLSHREFDETEFTLNHHPPPRIGIGQKVQSIDPLNDFKSNDVVANEEN